MKLNSENLNINLRHLRSLHAVARHGTFNRAAAELGVVPSALTETIRQLEEAIGAPLFDRNVRPIALTPLGRHMLAETSLPLEGLDFALARVRNHADMETGSLTVGAAPSAISGLVGPALKNFRAAYPNVRCYLRDDIGERLAKLVIDGSLDIAVAGNAIETPDLRQTTLARDRFGLACSAGHRLAVQRSLHLSALDPDEIISLDTETGTQQLLSACADVPASLRIGHLQAHSTVAQLCMIRAGLGVALLPENAVGLFGDPVIRFIPLEDLDLWRSLYLLEPARRPQSHIAEAFKRALIASLQGSAGQL
ncbi:LysR family transcriptional regulator [Rhizobium lusitanum]|uniref:LysR family transcriptional regulator n=1 Tax=Rhizobium lusitanum TaxID=293958 RepID=A0A6L9UHS8_9HYPH|nr:LysR family transcriptional regulator [Rhizobium lusitanum]NEI73677.1 LysR family transcriptional regulator [Rhizobium lusitanum]